MKGLIFLKFTMNKYAFFALSLLVTTLGFSNRFRVGIGDWKRIQFLLSFQEFGYFKRGGIGSLIEFLGIPKNDTTLLIISALFLVMFCLFTNLFLFRIRGAVSNFTYFSVFVLLSPAIFLNVGFDIGRYDTVNFIIFIMALTAIHKGHVHVGGILSFIAICFVHETFLFFWLPCILAYIISYMNDNKKSSLIYVSLYAVFALFFVIKFGGIESDFMNVLAHKYRILPDEIRGAMVWKSTITDNLESTIKALFSPNGFFVKIALSIPFLTFFAAFVIKTYRGNGIKTTLFSFAPLCGLSMLFIGIDSPRWFALISTTCVIVLIQEILQKRQSCPELMVKVPEGRTFSILMLLFFLLGPIGISESFHRPLPLHVLSFLETRMNVTVERNRNIEDVRKAASEGDPSSQCVLGMFYDSKKSTGEKASKDDAEAAYWYLKAAEQDFNPAQREIVRFYRLGRGVETSYLEAIKWFLRSLW